MAVGPDEFCLPQAVAAIGSENFIIGSDYPHPPSTFPNTAAGIESMAGLSSQDRENIPGRQSHAGLRAELKRQLEPRERAGKGLDSTLDRDGRYADSNQAGVRT